MGKTIKPISATLEPEFKARVRGGGKVDVITIPKTFMEKFNIIRGRVYRIRFIEETSI
ncbi:hypothetical protein KY360_01745 [Candidatus Woesearchaeota archaeon]|nr:hypothetical protein [Candidatus Woesearchaeota archaeon]